ncbi:hypothetical protein MYX77_11450, partial [Acidobacteriia bacterium AH_259_A11_L15]|nr:hypothetical protein [Acidobacteriia bacterium AH_259_A11_L15]
YVVSNGSIPHPTEKGFIWSRPFNSLKPSRFLSKELGLLEEPASPETNRCHNATWASERGEARTCYWKCFWEAGTRYRRAFDTAITLAIHEPSLPDEASRIPPLLSLSP